MTVSEKVLEKKHKDKEFVELKVNKKYLDLFKEICEENEIDFDKELNIRLENALVDSFNNYHSECLRKDRALRFLKGGKNVKRIPGFNLQNIKKMLAKMDSIDEQIEWLEGYVDGMQKTRETMYFGPRGLPTTSSRQEQFAGLTPYMKVYPQAIEEIQKLIRALKAEKIVEEKIIHKF